MSGARFLALKVNPTNQVLFNRDVTTALNRLRSGIVNVRAITAAHTVDDSDYLILVDATSAGVTVTLPPIGASRGRVLIVKKTDASGNSVTIDGTGSETIDGATTKATSTQYGVLHVIGGESEWALV